MKNIEFENIKSEYIKDLALFNETEINDEKIRNDFYNLEIYSEEEMDVCANLNLGHRAH